MPTFKYYELIAFFYEGIFEQLKQGIALEMATNISFDSFWLYPESENRLLNLIVLIHFINVKYSSSKAIDMRLIELYKNQLKFVKNDDLYKWLSPVELEHFNETRYNLDGYINDFLLSAKQKQSN